MRAILLHTIVLLLLLSIQGISQISEHPFEQLEYTWPSPNEYRTASGAPGHKYWQQQVDYQMDIVLDEANNILKGKEIITYHNNSPDVLNYLWVQLDQNVRKKESLANQSRKESIENNKNLQQVKRLKQKFDGGFQIKKVSSSTTNLNYVINETMMRIDLPQPLLPNKQVELGIEWQYNINNHRIDRARSGFEHFAEDNNNVYSIAQFFPRLCVYNDSEGWQNMQFYGKGEFALEFGNYDVNITVPSDHLVAATGTLINENNVLSSKQRERLKQAKNDTQHPVVIQTIEEANQAIQQKTESTKTWKFQAKNVRDFAFASSRRFIWDAMAVKLKNNEIVMAQSMYVKEGNCLWSKYSTKAVAHTLKWYSEYTFDYPYPNAWSIDGSMGMEYPMICFNYGRCEPDNTYSKRMKYGHISVIIHEVGHNWFPMIVNSDERQWTWMDEGLNSYVQFLTEQQWERNYPSRRGYPNKIVPYMSSASEDMVPIMTNSESVLQFGNNAYGKPATALNILRETVVGRNIFDFAFKEYSNRWKFKHPNPYDFFRTIEDAAATDLDWFWNSWFYTTNPVDLGISTVNHTMLSNPIEDETEITSSSQPVNITDIRNAKEIKTTYSEQDPTIIDFYTNYDPKALDPLDKQSIEQQKNQQTQEELQFINDNKHLYEISFENIGNNPMPIILLVTYEDNTTKEYRFPVDVWRTNPKRASKVLTSKQKIISFELDPYNEIADIDDANDHFPAKPSSNSFEVFKRANFSGNPMQRNNKIKKDSKP